MLMSDTIRARSAGVASWRVQPEWELRVRQIEFN